MSRFISALRRYLFYPAFGLVVLFVIYVLTHTVQLAALPVFADEAIYIRWAQLIIDDWPRYLFFPLNDGKTPLFMWLLVPLQYLGNDQLWSARILSVIVGFLQVLTTGYLIQLLGGRAKTVWLSMLLVTFLPFWYFHHRMALIDGLLVLFLSLSLVSVLHLLRSTASPQKTVVWMLCLAVSFGAALWTKLPAVLFIPSLLLFSVLPVRKTWFERSKLLTLIGTGLGGGLLLFSLLKLNPTFGQLFSRGSDFLYPWRDVFFEGAWRQTLPNIPTYISYFVTYLSWPLMALVVAGLFIQDKQRTFQVLFWAALLFLLPISLLGRVVYPRYLLPAALFFTLSGSLVIQSLVDQFINRTNQIPAKSVAGMVIALILAQILVISSAFIGPSLFNASTIPFVSADTTQYLTEWSSGHGLKETAELIQSAKKSSTLAVATEGYFGTLPDGLSMYFHRRSVEGLYIEGIGQPVISIPESFKLRANKYDQVWLVVNSHRMLLPLSADKLLKTYCRPFNAPCLQVWDITSLVKQ